MRSRTGGCRTASPARRPRRRSPASSTTRCAGARRSASCHGRSERPRAVLLGMLRRERRLDSDAIARLADGARFAPPPLSDDEQRRLAAADLDGRAAAMCRRLSRNGSIRISPACSARSAPPRARRWRAARRSICASTRSRASATRRPPRSPISIREPTRWSPVGLAHHARGRRQEARRSTPSPPSSRAWSRCRTRARSSPRCSPAPSPASRWSISAPAPAARRSRSRRRWRITARFTPPTPTSAGSRRSTSGSSAPARATCRSARRNPSATSSPISPAAPISC